MQRNELKKLNLPDCPGVYMFTKGRGRGKTVLYVGKATSLRDRVRSYFDDALIETRGPRIVDMVTRADSVSYEATPTVLEALVREAALIRTHRPPSNVEGKDDKTFLYAVITDEPIPRVLAIRRKDIDFKNHSFLQGSTLYTRLNLVGYKTLHGPFPSGTQLRVALRLLQRIFPFYDTPRPVGTEGKFLRGKIEFNRQLGQYPRNVTRAAYQRTIRHVSYYLSGRVKMLRKLLEREMKRAAREERFEEAERAKRQLFALDHVQDVALIRDERSEENVNSGRIEGYDVAHISGTNAIGVLTVIENGVPDRTSYRTFRIRGSVDLKAAQKTRTSKTRKSDDLVSRLNNDIASLREVLTRRLAHTEWPLPRAFVVDGGKTHKQAAESVLKEAGIGIPVVAVVKDEKHRPREVIGALRARISDADAVIANTEAHRFALARHRLSRRRSLRM